MSNYPTYKLGEIVDFYSGYGFPKNLQGKKTGKYPFYKVGDISKNVQNGFSHLLLCDNYIDDTDLLALKGVLLPQSTLVFAKIGEALKLNRRALTKELCLVDNNVVGIKAKTDKCLDLYLFYYFKTIKLEKYSRATTVPSVRKSDIELIPIPLPPPSTQHAIVSRIEALFAELDKGVQHLRTAQQQIKTYRQAVLNHWLNNEDGKWEMVKLGEVADAIDPEPSHRTPKIQKDGIPFVSIKDCDYITNTINLKTARLVSKDILTEHKERYSIKEGDFVIGKIGTIGNPVNVILPQEYALSANVVLIQPTDKINAKFLYNAFRSNIVEKQLFDGKKATTQAAFGIKKVRLIEIPLPPLTEQQRIVNEIESRLLQATASETYIENALQQAEALRQSILKKAFGGELV